MKEPLHRFFGYTIDESIERVPNELEIDAVGLWQIIPSGKYNFGLSGDVLEDFTRRHIIELIRRGAFPVRGSAEEGRYWEPQLQYGETPQEIAENVLKEWEASGGEDPDVSGLWFCLPENM